MPAKKPIPIKASEEDLKGRYANIMQVAHTKEEFIFDFFRIHEPLGSLVSRIITSPGHAKRIMVVLRENLEKYENKFGKIEESDEPRKIGFRKED